MDQNNKTAKVALRAVHRCERYLMYLTPQHYPRAEDKQA